MDPVASRDLIEEIRVFNRFYTQRLGTLNERLLDSQLSLTQARVLWELAQGGQVGATDLCRQLGLDPSYLSRILADYEGRGWVTRTAAPEDARRSVVGLTEAGRTAFRPLDQASRDQLQAWLEPMPPADREALVAAMRRVMRLLGSADRPLVVLRSHRPGDMGWIIERQARLYADEYGWNQEFEALVAEIGARFLRRNDPAREHCWVAEADGERVGSITVAEKSATVAQLRMLFVETRARGCGIGRALVEESLAFARRTGYRRMVLYTVEDLHAARRIYEAAGFRLKRSEPGHCYGKDLVEQHWERNL